MATEQERDREVDVIIVGYGLAGGVAAIEASDAGARVLMLEKGKYPGGASILAGGGVKVARDVEAAASYLTATSGDRVAPDLVRTFAQGMTEVEPYLRQLAQVDNAVVTVTKTEDKAAIGCYPFPGADTIDGVRVTQVPGFTGFPWVRAESPAGVNLMKLVMDNVQSRQIEVLTSTKAEKLVTDGSGAVSGVVVRSQGGERLVKARRAVILACGGFEQNRELQLQYLQGKTFYSMAPLTHTGDGIFMAQKVGAALWHMWHVHGSYGFKFPEFPIAFRHVFGGARNPRRIMPWIVVDKYGARYMNEYQLAPQDTMHRAMEIFDPDMPGYPRIPSYLIFDEAGRKRGPIANPLHLGELAYEWSKDNLAEVEKGWILRAGSIKELALKLNEAPENEGKMEPQILEATIAQWNNVVVPARTDPLHRPAGTMTAIKEPPFYAVEVWPIITNTQGGPAHNSRQQVLDAFGQPIPHLYAAGELGSFWGHVYLLGGNLSECIISGRIAGRNAAGEYAI